MATCWTVRCLRDGRISDLRPWPVWLGFASGECWYDGHARGGDSQRETWRAARDNAWRSNRVTDDVSVRRGMAGADEVHVVRCTYGCQDTTCNITVGDEAVSRAVRSYRPHGSLARVLYDKRKADEWLAAYDKRKVSATFDNKYVALCVFVIYLTIYFILKHDNHSFSWLYPRNSTTCRRDVPRKRGKSCGRHPLVETRDERKREHLRSTFNSVRVARLCLLLVARHASLLRSPPGVTRHVTDLGSRDRRRPWDESWEFLILVLRIGGLRIED